MVAIPKVPFNQSTVQAKMYLTTVSEYSSSVAVLHPAGSKIEGIT
jgi:hypothetical protein